MEMQSGMVSRVGQRSHVLDGGPHWHHLANTVKRLCAGATNGSATQDGDAACSQITVGNLVRYNAYM